MLWSCGIVAADIIGCGPLRWLLVFAACGVCPALAKLDVLISACRAENSCVEALEKPGKLRVESQLVSSLDQFCAQPMRSLVGREQSW